MLIPTIIWAHVVVSIGLDVAQTPISCLLHQTSAGCLCRGPGVFASTGELNVRAFAKSTLVARFPLVVAGHILQDEMGGFDAESISTKVRDCQAPFVQISPHLGCYPVKRQGKDPCEL